MWSLIVVIVGLFVGSESILPSEKCTLPAKGPSKFPPNFSFGTSTSAYQTEGSWNADGKGPSVWDEFAHSNPEKIVDGSNGDIAADSYRLFDKDLEALKFLKVQHYRFSISWPRIYPTGDVSSKNQKGIDHYNTVIDKLLANGIQPMVTMFHNDLPAELQKLGGLTTELFIEYFEAYADELFKNYGDRVKTWITFNEPIRFCEPGYGSGSQAPQITASGIGDYICVANMLKAHAAAYHLYRSKYFQAQGGKIGIAVDSVFSFSKTNDTELVNRSLQFKLGMQMHPIYSKSGGFPELVVKDIERNSLQEGRRKSRLPNLDEGGWKEKIRGSADFFGLNHYTSTYVRKPLKPMGKNPSMDRDFNTAHSMCTNCLQAQSFWLRCVPEGMEELLKYVRDEYNNVEVIILENGWADNKNLEDENRILAMKSYIQAVLNAINDGCNVTGYTYWSLLDSFEWTLGYTDGFGLFSVDMNSPKRERTPKKSAKYFKKIIESRSIPNISSVCCKKSSNPLFCY